ncbi:MAG: hypothetical protein PVJ64_10000 [Gemmatimonadales bacterium]|jgi:hypothetical protein
MIRKVLSLVLMLLAAGAPARAQTDVASQVSVGDRVRVRAEHWKSSWWVGTVAALGSDTLVVRREDSTDTLAFPIATIGKLEVSRGRKSNFLPGLAYGALGGALFFGSIGLLSGDDPEDSFIRLTAADKALIGAAFGAGLGAVLGGFFGAVSHRDRWESVPLDRVAVDLSVRHDGGVTLSLAYGF